MSKTNAEVHEELDNEMYSVGEALENSLLDSKDFEDRELAQLWDETAAAITRINTIIQDAAEKAEWADVPGVEV